MGIDVEFWIRKDSKWTDAELRDVSYEIGSRFQGAGVILYQCEYFLRVNEEDARVAEFSTLCRYYGPGYERGDPLQWINMAEFVEFLIPGAVVYYGSDDVGEPTLFDNERRASLKRHFFEVGNAPYCHRPSGVICPRCQKEAGAWGWARQDVISATCAGCGNKWEAVNGVLKPWGE